VRTTTPTESDLQTVPVAVYLRACSLAMRGSTVRLLERVVQASGSLSKDELARASGQPGSVVASAMQRLHELELVEGDVQAGWRASGLGRAYVEMFTAEVNEGAEEKSLTLGKGMGDGSMGDDAQSRSAASTAVDGAGGTEKNIRTIRNSRDIRIKGIKEEEPLSPPLSVPALKSIRDIRSIREIRNEGPGNSSDNAQVTPEEVVAYLQEFLVPVRWGFQQPALQDRFTQREIIEFVLEHAAAIASGHFPVDDFLDDKDRGLHPKTNHAVYKLLYLVGVRPPLLYNLAKRERYSQEYVLERIREKGSGDQGLVIWD
jgi:hypothetical protein